MNENDTIFKVFAAAVPIILMAMGHMYSLVKANQKMLEQCLRMRLSEGEKIE